MTQSPLPLHQPAGSPGNLNDVAELRQMLANQTAIADAARDHVAALEVGRAEDQKTIAGLKEKVEKLISEKDRLASEVENLENDIGGFENAAEEAERRAADLEEDLADLDDAARGLAGVRRMIKGSHPAATEELTHILDRSFETWKHYA